MTLKLLVSIHDVTPAHRDRVFHLWKLCADRGITPALLVVPNWHGKWPLEQNSEFVDWLRWCANRDAELFLHGERHDELGSPRDWRGSLRAMGQTAREGEFLMLGEDKARERIQRNIALLHELKIPPVGFVAPAWLSQPSMQRIVSECGLRFSENTRAITLHEYEVDVSSPVIRWSARTWLRAQTSIAIADLCWHYYQLDKVVRIALHPSDLHHSDITQSLTRTLDRWLAVRPSCRYADL